MDAHDYRKRAAWLLAVSARLPSREVAATLAGYADEMLAKADCIEQLARSRPSRSHGHPILSPFPATQKPHSIQ